MMVCHVPNRESKGIPVGQPEYVRQFLEEKADEHSTFFQRIPMVEDPQAAWLLLLMCASTRANFWLRGVQPEWTSTFAETHDAHVWECLRRILNCHGGISRSHCFVTVLPRGFGAHQRRQDQRGSPLGQLGRLPENGAPETPSSSGLVEGPVRGVPNL